MKIDERGMVYMNSKVFSILKDDDEDWGERRNRWEHLKEEDFKWLQELYGRHKDKHSKTDHALDYRTRESLACRSCTKKARQGRNKIITPIIRKIGTIIKKLVEESNGVISVDYSRKRSKDTSRSLRKRHDVHKYTWTIKNELNSRSLIQILLVIYDDYFKGDNIINEQVFYIYGKLEAAELPLQLEGEIDIILNPKFEQLLHNEIYIGTEHEYKPPLVVASEERSFILLKSVVDENPNANLGQAVVLEGVFYGGKTYRTIDNERKINNSLIIKLDWDHDYRDHLVRGNNWRTVDLLDDITPDTISNAEMILCFNLDNTDNWCVEKAVVIPESDFYNAQNPYIKWVDSNTEVHSSKSAKPVTPVKNTSELLSGKIAISIGELCLSPNSKKQFQHYPKNDFLATMVLMSRNKKDWNSMWG